LNEVVEGDSVGGKVKMVEEGVKDGSSVVVVVVVAVQRRFQ
jgi:hypothetical protein